MKQGVLYVATGRKYRLECNTSARSVRQVMPNLPITIFTDSQSDLETDLFDCIEILKHPTYSSLDKIAPLCESPYERTLFLDTDTFMIREVFDLFDVLEKFDLTYCHAPGRGADNPKYLPECPLAFTEPNTGVMSYVSTDEVIKLFRDWSLLHQSLMDESTKKKFHDQPAFRQVLYSSDVRSLVIPPEYNLRTPFPFFKGKMYAKILHGREPSLSKAIEALSAEESKEWAVYDFRPKRGFWKKVRDKVKNITLFKPLRKF